MLNIELVRFDSQDIITASAANCVCNENCYLQYIDEAHSKRKLVHGNCGCDNDMHWIKGETRPYNYIP